MATQEIKVGVVVTLKSGSPGMTVIAADESTTQGQLIDCLLWDSEKRAFVKLENMPAASLTELA